MTKTENAAEASRLNAGMTQVTIYRSMTGRFCYRFRNGRLGQRSSAHRASLLKYLREAGFVVAD